MANNQKYSPLYLFYESSYSNPDIILLMIMVIIVKIIIIKSFVEKYKVNGC